MSNRLTAFWLGGMGLMWSCAVIGCSGPTPDDKDDLVLVSKEFTVKQGSNANLMVIKGKGDLEIVGEKDGVTARFDKNPNPSTIVVSVAEEAKVGQVELIIKNKAGKTASLKITVQEVVLEQSTRSNVDVAQGGKEVTHKVQFIVQEGLLGYTKAKKAVSVSEGKDGLSAKLDNNGESITLSATKMAQLGEQELTVKGHKYTYKLKVTVKVADAK